MYPDPQVARFVQQHFTPVRVHVKHQADEFKRLGQRYGAQWTPTILVLDPAGEERHRIEGFLPADDLLSQLALGLAHSDFARGDYGAAERRFRQLLNDYPSTDAAPEAQYWAGVSRYKATGEADALADTHAAFGERYQDSTWAKKASVWGTG